MLGHGAKFSQKMEQAIAALLSHRSVEEAARAVGISPNTLLRWMKEPEFEAALREAQRTAFSEAIGRLRDFAGAAVTTVLKIMVDSNAPAGTRLRAAEIVLEQGGVRWKTSKNALRGWSGRQARPGSRANVQQSSRW
jgi:transposase-like protein